MNIYKELHKWIEPSLIARELAKEWGEDGLIWLDGDGSELGQKITIAANPVKSFSCHGLPNTKNSKNPFHTLKKLPQGHWTGWLSYEAGAWIESNSCWKKNTMSILYMACHDPVFKFDLKSKDFWICSSEKAKISSTKKWLKKISRINKEEPIRRKIIAYDSWEWVTTEEEYIEGIQALKKHINNGDIFQANLTRACFSKFPNSSPLEIFLQLRQSCPAPFSGLIVGSEDSRNEAILSASPERFLKVWPNGRVETRPIKGTRPRSEDKIKDSFMAANLITSTKDRAENIMIVDLLRNDFGRVCIPGSIQVNQLVGLETYHNVHHLTSVINGLLPRDSSWIDLLQACWPGGSITGAPKIRACQRINELEPKPRGVYCGSIMHIDWDGTFDSNILIRTLQRNKKELIANAGCGIVADSNPLSEVEELKWKLMPLLQSLEK